MTASNLTPAGEEEISARAYEFWESEGRPEGRDQEHWYRARALVAGETPGAEAEGSTRESPAPETPYVRPAGRSKMDLPPAQWTKTDEEVDESFPASDPPGNY